MTAEEFVFVPAPGFIRVEKKRRISSEFEITMMREERMRRKR
jgi:hypothetical protein